MRRALTVLLLWCLAAVPAGVAGAQSAPGPTTTTTVPGGAAGDPGATTTSTAVTATTVASTTTTTAAPAEPAPVVAGTDVPAELPPGFTDGVPVGGTEEDAEGTAAVGAPSTRSTTTVRYFGRGAWQAIEGAAAATSRPCALSDAGLVALMVSPVFKESSAATTASSAPSPMTLSRWDEWSGTYSTSNNRDANYGLYAFRQPYTAYPRAYWHPGVGIWQYDSAGVGAPYTAVERMDLNVVARDVAAGMAQRYCNPTRTTTGHDAPYTAQDRRNAAWWPWNAGSTSCTLCQQEFARMTATTPYFQNLRFVDGISATGGASRRTCTIGGSAPLECWYVDPSVGVIEGATAWATLAVDGRADPKVAPAPLSEAFYVVKRDGHEERHWLRADTGYGTDISARRQLGRNARPRSNQAGSGLAWSASSGLCDLSAGRGDCAPPSLIGAPPSGMSASDLQVSGAYEPVPLDADGDGRGDVLWYAPGTGADALWLGQGAGGFRSVPLRINGHYDRVVPFDLDGDGDDDVLWYATSTGVSSVWRARGDGTFSSFAISPGVGLDPIVLDADADGQDAIVWYGPGSRPDAAWWWNGSSFSKEAKRVSGVYRPLVGDFDGNGREDIFWYGPGAAADSVWLHPSRGGLMTVPVRVGGVYEPLVGDYDGDGNDDVIWYGAGAAADAVWYGGPFASFQGAALQVNGRYDPVVLDLGGDGRDDVLWYAPGSGADSWFSWEPTRSRSSRSLRLDGTHRAVVGELSGGGADGIFWYAPGPAVDVVWWR